MYRVLFLLLCTTCWIIFWFWRKVSARRCLQQSGFKHLQHLYGICFQSPACCWGKSTSSILHNWRQYSNFFPIGTPCHIFCWSRVAASSVWDPTFLLQRRQTFQFTSVAVEASYSRCPRYGTGESFSELNLSNGDRRERIAYSLLLYVQLVVKGLSYTKEFFLVLLEFSSSLDETVKSRFGSRARLGLFNLL